MFITNHHYCLFRKGKRKNSGDSDVSLKDLEEEISSDDLSEHDSDSDVIAPGKVKAGKGNCTVYVYEKSI